MQFERLDAAQLVKHAFGLRTAVQPRAKHAGKRPVLFYLYAEPESWPGRKRSVPLEGRIAHRREIVAFSDVVAGNEVVFHSCSYSELLADWCRATIWMSWAAQPNHLIRAHAAALMERFDIGGP
jgi:hypothetical protein